MKITHEQKEIIDCDLQPGETLKVIAFAGTGKTYTLVEYAKARPTMKFLYVAFNKGVQVEAQNKFPSNVTCKTSHALAFRTHGVKHKGRFVPSFKANIVMEALGLKDFADARFTIDTLNNYLISSDPKVSKKHIPKNAELFYRENKKKMLPLTLVEYANQLGRLMCDGSNTNIGMLHDGYLKLFQNSKPVLQYDCILLDEAQDTNLVTSDIIFSQCQSDSTNRKSASIILVGDSHQQIYSFRGARDILNNINSSKMLYLTKSFRFDNNIARVANMVLETFKNEKKKIKGLPVNKTSKPNWNPDKYTIIARTNATIFKKAVELNNKNKIGFIGGIEGYRFGLIKDVYNLFAEKYNQVSDNYIRAFGGYGDLKSYAQDVEDFELLGICKVIEEYKQDIPYHIKQIYEKAVESGKAEIILTTAHKAKGLEWDNVLMMDDFQELLKGEEFTDPSGIEPDEFNLIYVSMTRAKINLRFDQDSKIPGFIRLFQEKSAA